jgi:hypothetical protein
VRVYVWRIRSVAEEAEGHKNILFLSQGSLCKFQEAERHNIILFLSQDSSCKLNLNLASKLCQTVGDEQFFYLAYLFIS